MQNNIIKKQTGTHSDEKFYIYIVGLCLLIYSKTVFYAFSPLDDAALIFSRITWLQDIHNIKAIFTEPLYWGIGSYYYRPILILTFMLDAITGNGSAISFHLTNIFLHIVMTLILYELFRELRLSPFSSLLITIIFIIHPVNSSVVAWIPGRNDSLLGIFAVTAFISLLRYFKTDDSKWLVTHLAVFILALLVKENGVIIVVISAVYIVLFYGYNRLFREKLLIFSWLIIGFSWIFTRSLILGHASEMERQSLLKIIFGMIDIFFITIGKLLFPVNLSVSPNLLDSTPVYGIFSFLFLLIIIFISRIINSKLFIFGIIWFISFWFIPELWVTMFRIGYSYEHRLYTPMIGFLIMISQIRIDGIIPPSLLKLKWPVFLLILIIFGGINMVRTAVYKDFFTFSKALAEEAPSMPFAKKFRGDILTKLGNYTEAEKYYSESLKIDSTQADVYYNRGCMYRESGRMDLALADFETSIRIDSTFDRVYFDKGLLYRLLKDDDKALKNFNRAIFLNPDEKTYYNERGLLFLSQKNFSNALQDFTRAIEIDSEYFIAYHNRSVAYFYLHDYPHALEDLTIVEELGGQVNIDFLNTLMAAYSAEYNKVDTEK